MKDIQKDISILNEIAAPIKQGEMIGHITYEVDGVNYTTELIASYDVEKIKNKK